MRSPFHLRILRVALLPPDQAIPEWEILRPQLDLDTLWDPDAIKLLPLVYRALVTAGTEDPDLAAAERRRTACVVRQPAFVPRRRHRARRARGGRCPRHVAQGRAARGAVLSRGWPPADGRRRRARGAGPRRRRRRRAGAGGLAERFEARSSLESSRTASRCSTRSTAGAPTGFPIDLHWRYVPWIARDGSGQDPGLWARARPLDVVGHHALSPSPDDLLLLVILHAYRAGWATAPRWIADTTYLLRTLGPELDWDRFVERTVQGHLVEPVRDALEFVYEQFDAPVPLAPLGTLRSTRVGRWEQHRHRVASREVTGERRALFGELDDARTGWARWSLNLTPVATVRSFPLFVTRRLGLERPSEIPAAVAGRGYRNVKNAVRADRA